MGFCCKSEVRVAGICILKLKHEKDGSGNDTAM
jgi:hypothetical protein